MSRLRKMIKRVCLSRGALNNVFYKPDLTLQGITNLTFYTLKILTSLDADNISNNQKTGHAAAMPEVLASALGYFDSAIGTIAFTVNSEVSECHFA